MEKAKPRRIRPIVSDGCGHFGPVFSQVATDDAMLYIAELGLLGWGGKPN